MLQSIACACTYVRGRATHTTACMWRSGDNSEELVFFFHHISARDWIQAVRLYIKNLYLWCLLTNPCIYFLSISLHTKIKDGNIFQHVKDKFYPDYTSNRLWNPGEHPTSQSPINLLTPLPYESFLSPSAILSYKTHSLVNINRAYFIFEEGNICDNPSKWFRVKKE